MRLLLLLAVVSACMQSAQAETMTWKQKQRNYDRAAALMGMPDIKSQRKGTLLFYRTMDADVDDPNYRHGIFYKITHLIRI